MSTAVLLCGLYIVPRDDSPSTTPDARIPLKRVAADVSIVDCVASVTLSQVYVNDGPRPVEAVYKFPVYESAAVYAFEAEVDGAVIKGVCKEREQAAKEYNEAVAAGDRAFLVEEQKADIFQISVGNIPSGKPVTIRISYLHECPTDEDNDELRFTIPTTIASQTYGMFTPPAGTNLLPGGTTYDNSADYTLSVAIDVRTAGGPVTEVSSTTHPIKVSIDGGNPRHATAKLAIDKVYLDRDFILVVKSPGLDKPRAVLEKDAATGTKCCVVTFVPKFKVRDAQTEIIFVLDRSGSMEGENIESARTALLVFLKSLPPTCKFNIVGFGSNHELLFPSAVPYNETNLAAAVKHVEKVQADLGGTELLAPLEASVKDAVKSGWQRSVFVLTDGEIYSPDSVFALAAQASKSQKTRFFTLGVGDAVSHHLVNGLARAGMGAAEFVGAGERMEAKVVKLIKAGVRGFVTDYKVTWLPAAAISDLESGGTSSEAAAPPPYSATPGTFFDEGLTSDPLPTREVPKAKVPAVQQAPFRAPPIYPGSRYICCSILDAKLPDPTSVTVSGVGPDGPLEIPIPVGENTFTTSARPFLHVLAAKKLVQDLEEGTSWMHAEGAGAPDESRVRAETVRLSSTYGIVSKYTSYVAVQVLDAKDKASGAPEKIIVPSRVEHSAQKNSLDKLEERAYVATAFDQTQGLAVQSKSYAKKKSKGGFGLALPAVSLPSMPSVPSVSGFASTLGGLFGKKDSAAPSAARASGRAAYGGRAAAAPAPPPAVSAAPAPAPIAHRLAAKRMDLDDEAAEISVAQELRADVFDSPSAGESDAKEREESAKAPPRGGKAASPAALLQLLVSLQRFDGSFPADSRLFGHANGVQTSAPSGRSAEEWATAVAIVVMEVVLAALKDEWELLKEKAVDWLDAKIGDSERKKLIGVARGQITA